MTKPTSEQLNDLKKLLKRFYAMEGKERVGFIGDNKIFEVENRAENPLIGFYVTPQDIITYTEEKKCWATWHTHPGQDCNLSGEDSKMFLQWPDLVHFIIGNDGVKVYQYNPDKKAVLQI